MELGCILQGAMVSTLKQHVLETADRLFYAEGVRAIGIDRIIAESEIAKASFYRFFKSKDVLITEWLVMRDVQWRTWLEDSVEMLAPLPVHRPLVVFDALYARFRQPIFRGCAFLNTIAEISRQDHPAVEVARKHKKSVESLLRQYLQAANYVDAELAAMFMQLVDGAIVSAVREHSPQAALRAKEMARLLLSHPMPNMQLVNEDK